MTSVEQHEPVRLRAIDLAAVGRAAGAGGMAGVIAGVLVGGFGSRIAMRISGAMTAPELIGQATANGNRVGEITLGGTLALLFFGGVITGLLGGLLYVLARPWLAGLGRWRGVAFGALLYLAFGSLFVEGDNFDFGRFGSLPLNVAMFVMLFPLFGTTVAALADRFERDLASGRAGDLLRLGALLGALGTAGILVLVVGSTTEGLLRALARPSPATAIATEGEVASGLLLVALLGLLVALRWPLIQGGRRFGAAGEVSDRPIALTATYLVLAAAVAAGAVRTIGDLVELLW